jgi:DNA-binding GntR family transcriptional regulator
MSSDVPTPGAAADPLHPDPDPDEGRSLGTYRKLRRLIVQGRLAPGSRIVERELADRLDVSRTPVRSAIQRLRQEGYIVSAGDGKRSENAVAPLTREDARELLYILGTLEGLAASRCAEADEATRHELAEELATVNERLREAARREPTDRQGILTLDERFHATYVEAGAGSRLRAFHEMVRPQKERYLRFYMGGLVNEIETSIGEHEVIVDAIRRGDPAAAGEAVEATWKNGAKRLAAVIERRGESGSW